MNLEQIEEVPIRKLKLYPGNPRRGDVPLIAQSLEANGQFRPIIVQRSTSYVLAGNHTLRAARSLKWKAIAAVFLDVDDTAAKRIVLADNKTSDAGTYDQDALAELLASLDSLEGTGYDGSEVADLLGEIADASPLPEEGEVPVDERPVPWGVVVEVPDEAAQTALMERLMGEGFAVRALVAG